MMERVISIVIGMIKERMNEHAHGSMNMAKVNEAMFHEIAGSYRGMQECLDIIDAALQQQAKEDDQL